MPKMTNTNLQQLGQVGAGYAYSGTKLEILAKRSNSWACGVLIVDRSGTTDPFIDILEQWLAYIVRSCTFSPARDSMMLTGMEFDDELNELFGFTLLEDFEDQTSGKVEDSRFKGVLKKNGNSTALYDAIFSGCEALVKYADTLRKKKFFVSGNVYILTDGLNNDSKKDISEVKRIIAEIQQSETFSGFNIVLLGVNTKARDYSAGYNTSRTIGDGLKDFAAQVGITKYIDMGDVADRHTAVNKLAKVADFISQSMSMSSQQVQSAGTGAAPQSTSLPQAPTF